MDNIIIIIIFIFCVLAIGIIAHVSVHTEDRKKLNRYWSRSSISVAHKWKKAFPEKANEDIREFLQIFVDAFALSRKMLFKFEPDEKVLEVYKAIYSPSSRCDAMELETLFEHCAKRYNIKLESFWNDDTTLEEIFEIATKYSDSDNELINT